MSVFQGDTSNRGATLFAAVVFVAILAATMFLFQAVSPNSRGQTAAGAAATDTKVLNQKCEAGTVNEIQIGRGTFKPVKDSAIDCYAGRTEEQKNKNQPNPEYEQCAGIGAKQCQVIACAPDELAVEGKDQCSIIATCDTNDAGDCETMTAKINSGTPGVFSAMQRNGGDLPGFVELLKQDVNGGSQLAAGFADPIKQAQGQIQEQIRENTATMNGIKQYIDGCNTDPVSCNEQFVKDRQKEIAALQKQNTDLLNQMKELNDTKTALSPAAGPGDVICSASNPPTCRYPDGRPAPVPGGTACTGANCTGSGGPIGNPSSTGFGSNSLGSMLSGLGRGLSSSMSAPPPAAPAPVAQACSTDQNAYAQQQQQYQQQLQQYNYQLQQYQYQQQLQQYQAAQYGGYSSAPMAPLPAQPVACNPSTQNQCQTQPQQPAASTCTSGFWQPVYSGNCVVNWRCIQNPNATSTAPTAAISCSPQLADVGMSVGIAYSCSSGVATSSSFTITNPTAGTATSSIQQPPQGTNTATYTLACKENNQTSGAQCSVQINQPSIVLVANPKTVQPNTTSLIGWITSGMQSCVISSPDQPVFTAENAANTSVAGTAITLPIATTTRFVLHCETIAGGVKNATTTVSVGTGTTTQIASISVQSSVDGGNTSHGASTTITWNAINPPADSAVSLWLVDASTAQATALIAGAQPLSGNYTWHIPSATSTCPNNALNVCGADLIAGRHYQIEADVYTPANAYVGDGAVPANPIVPLYGAYSAGTAFTVSN